MPSSTAAHRSIVSLRGLGVTLTGAAGPVEILRGIDLALAPGETVSVVGPSGAGKTTLLMVVGGLERPSTGRVEVAGEDLAALDEDALARFRGRRVGIVFQAFHLIPTMTAIENVAVPRELAGAADAFDRAREELAAVGLGGRLEHYPGELSGGEQQRVAIARALVNRPDLLLADEPTGNLDAATGEQVIRRLFARSRDRGAALLLITHEARLAALCDRTIRMTDGRIEAEAAEVAAAGSGADGERTDPDPDSDSDPDSGSDPERGRDRGRGQGSRRDREGEDRSGLQGAPEGRGVGAPSAGNGAEAEARVGVGVGSGAGPDDPRPADAAGPAGPVVPPAPAPSR